MANAHGKARSGTASDRTLLCRIGLHRWIVMGRPGTEKAYTMCRRCRKRRGGLMVDWSHGDLEGYMRSGLDDDSQDPKIHF